jgi:hypothetical protein
VTVVEASINKQKIGPAFKGEAGKIVAHLESVNKDDNVSVGTCDGMTVAAKLALEARLASEGHSEIIIDGKAYKVKLQFSYLLILDYSRDGQIQNGDQDDQ